MHIYSRTVFIGTILASLLLLFYVCRVRPGPKKKVEDFVFQRFQKTIKSPVSFTGVGLHSGSIVDLSINPAPENHGIVFRRIDNQNSAPITAHAFQVTSTNLATTIGSGFSKISTIEHLMAAIYSLGIDNALITVNGSEIPALDGSAKPYIDKFNEIGFSEQSVERSFFIIKKPFELSDNKGSLVKVEPSLRLQFRCSIDFPGVIGKQDVEVGFHQEGFANILSARTFCHADQVEQMKKDGLALGGSLQNAIVVSNTDILNKEGLRSKDEFAKHKLLDAIGDLALLGSPVIGKFSFIKSGHNLHVSFVTELLKAKHDYIAIIEPRHAAEEYKSLFFP